MKPTVGRVVHYQAYGTPGGEHPSVPRAAVIAAVHEGDECDLVVLNPGGLFFNRCKYSETPRPGCWNWPPREESPAEKVLGKYFRVDADGKAYPEKEDGGQ